MPERAIRVGFLWFAAILAGGPLAAQVLVRPTPAPLVTAERESWYQAGEPIPFAGNLYYPGGAPVFFNPNEMVRSGFHMGVPLYTRTTIEPYSIVYVPVRGGLMQPYERLRSGEIVGTAGSVPASVITPYESRFEEVLPQSPGLPSWTPTMILPERMALPPHTPTGERVRGIGAIFMEFEDVRWFSSGTTIEIDPSRMTRVGDYHGFGVWRDRNGRGDRIYVATSRAGILAVPYVRR
jgi:hypothetical protein